jgi:hypothetical protein
MLLGLSMTTPQPKILGNGLIGFSNTDMKQFEVLRQDIIISDKKLKSSVLSVHLIESIGQVYIGQEEVQSSFCWFFRQSKSSRR